MIPPGVTVLPALPLTPAGKVDRRALAGLAPADRRAAAGAYAPPRDPIEELLAPLWAEVLGVERVGVHDDFFTLGGHSLLGMQLTSRVADLFGVRLTVRALFEARTVGGLAERIAEELAAAGSRRRHPGGDAGGAGRHGYGNSGRKAGELSWMIVRSWSNRSPRTTSGG